MLKYIPYIKQELNKLENEVLKETKDEFKVKS